MKASLRTKTMAFGVFLFALFPLFQLFQSFAFGAEPHFSNSDFWIDAQCKVIIGSLAALVFSVIAPSVFCFQLKNRSVAILVLAGSVALILGVFLSADYGVVLLPKHWVSLAGLVSSGLLFLAGFVWVLLVSPSGEESETQKRAPIFASLGYLSLFLFNRCSGGALGSIGPFFWISASFSICALLVVLCIKEGAQGSPRRVDGPKPGKATPVHSSDGYELAERKSVQGLIGKLEGYGLSGREAEAIRLMVEGFSSESSAELMGVKPATVRTYLQRAYKKMGVNSAEESKSLLLASSNNGNSGRDEEGKNLPGDFSPKPEAPPASLPEEVAPCVISERFCRFAVPLSLVCLLLLLVPHEQFFVSEFWYHSEVFTLSIGLGLLISGSSVLCFGESFLSSRLRKPIACLVLAVLVFVALVLILLPVWKGSFLSWAGYGLFLSASLCLVSLGLSLAAVVLGAIRGAEGESGQPTERAFPLFVFAAVLGFVFEDTWRAATDDFTWWLQLGFLLTMLVYCLVSLKSRLLFGCVCVVLVACLVGTGFGVRAIFVCLLSFSFVLLLSERSLLEAKGDMGVALVGFGGSLIAFRLASDYWWDVMSRSAVSASIHGGQWLLGAVMPAFELLFLVSGLVAFAFLAMQRPSYANEELWKGQEQSVVLYLRSRGLGELEVKTISGVLQGKASAQIARDVHYALGSVNSARWSAYRKLGIHSKKELNELLRLNGFGV